MDLPQLRAFVAVADELHFQRAARRLNLSQPALSHRIKALETEAGVTLVARDRRSVALTPAGEAFLVRAREALAAADVALDEARAAAGAEPGVLRLGFVSYLNLRMLARSLAAFRVARPEIAIEQAEMPTAEVYEALKERTIDLGLAVLPATHPTLKVRKVADGFWSVVVRASHPLAAAAEDGVLALDRLSGEPLVMFERALNPALYDTCLARMRASGIAPWIVLETSQVQTGLDMARDGSGVYFVASYIVEPPPPDLVRLRLAGFGGALAVGAVWHEDNRTRVLADYLDHLRTEAAQAR